ncbi:MAG: hypothetical protein ACTTH7_00850 [Treponema sp.]
MPNTVIRQSAQRKTMSIVWRLTAAIILVSIGFLFFAGYRYNRSIRRIRAVLNSCSVTNTSLPCLVTLIGHGSSTASVHIAFTSPQGRPAGSYERSWQGSKLYLSAYSFRTNNGILVFPHRFYTKAEKKYKGLRLLRYYSDSEYPVIYDDPALTAQQRKAIKELFRLICSMSTLMRLFGDLQEITGSIDTDSVQTEYMLFVSPKKTLQFIPSVPQI